MAKKNQPGTVTVINSHRKQGTIMGDYIVRVTETREVVVNANTEEEAKTQGLAKLGEQRK